MEVDDRKNLYNVKNETDEDYEYDGDRDDFPHRPVASIKINDQISGSKWPIYVLIGIQAIVILALIILLGVNGVTLTHLNTLDICANSASASTGALTSDGGTTGDDKTVLNCSIGYSTLSDNLAQGNADLNTQISQMNWTLQNQIKQLIDMARDTSWKVDGLGTAADNNMNYIQNVSDILESVLQTTGDSAERLTNIIGTLSSIKDTSTDTAAVIDGILLVVNDLLALQNASTIFNSITPVSCADIKNVLPNSPSGYYHVNARNIYCNMDQLCGSGGGWTRLAYLNMKDATVTCPTGLRLYQSGSVRACGRPPSGSGGCSSINFPTNGLNYTQICGRVTGYQIGHTDAFSHSAGRSIDSFYVDGVSITRGTPRQHVWTFVSGLTQRNIGYRGSNCPCSTGSPQNPPSYVGSNYFCESGNPNTNWQSYRFYPNDPLWDGQGCGENEATCCAAPGLPWFHRDYGNSTTNDKIEMRFCSNEPTTEDVPVGFYEIYIQ